MTEMTLLIFDGITVVLILGRSYYAQKVTIRLTRIQICYIFGHSNN